MLSLKEKYRTEVRPALIEEFGFKNKMAVPKIEKAVVNVGFGKAVSGKASAERKKIFEPILEDLSLIIGQKLIPTTARKSISTFKLRRGMIIGAKATLRGRKMNDFLERLIHVALPRSRDFRGLNMENVDKNGNLTIGIKEHIIFPEVAPEKTRNIFSFEVTVVSTAKNQAQGLKLFKLLGFPLKLEA